MIVLRWTACKRFVVEIHVAEVIDVDWIILVYLGQIDLLAAARCNMFSQALVAYQLALMDFFTKTSETFHNTVISLSKEPHYSFTILKELTQGELPAERTDSAVEENGVIDDDQLLFFKVCV